MRVSLETNRHRLHNAWLWLSARLWTGRRDMVRNTRQTDGGTAWKRVTTRDGRGIASRPGWRILWVGASIGVLLVAGLLLSGVVAAAEPIDLDPDEDLEGDGVEGDPYIVTNASELQAIEGNLSAHYELGGDVDASETSDWSFVPIGSSAEPFEGTLDGADHSIESLEIRGSGTNVGLFGSVGTDGTITDLELTDVDLTQDEMSMNYVMNEVDTEDAFEGELASSSIVIAQQAGGLAGESHGELKRVSVTGDVTADATADTTVAVTVTEDGNVTVDGNVSRVEVAIDQEIGGLVGQNHGTIEESSTESDVTVAAESDVEADVAVAGELTVSEWVLWVDVTLEQDVGGLVGQNHGEIRGSQTAGSTTADGEADVSTNVDERGDGNLTVAGEDSVAVEIEQATGGLVGNNEDGGALTSSHATGDVSGSESSVGGLAGVNDNGEITNSSAAADVTGSNLVGGLVGFNDGGEVSNSSTTGDVTGTSFVGGLVGFNDNGELSTPSTTGNVTGSSFVGGLVGFNSNGEISTPSTTGDVAGSEEFVGGLIGLNTGEVSHSFATGDVTGSEEFVDDPASSDLEGELSDSSVAGLEQSVDDLVSSDFRDEVSSSSATDNVTDPDFVGGLVGFNDNGEIANSSATGDVTGSSFVGGLVGLHDNGEITNSSATGGVTGSEQFVGGLVGYSLGGEIATSYATGDVTGSDFVGGLVSVNEGEVASSYAVGNVTGSGDIVGGLVGVNDDEIVTSYWDTETTTQTDGVGSGPDDAIPLETSDMKGDAANDNMDVDFETTWGVVASGTHVSYPYLGANHQAPEPGLETVGDDSLLEAYANEEGVIDTDGLRAAVDDWRTDDLETAQLRTVIDAWRSGEPVV